MDPDQTAPVGSLIRVHTVCLYAKCKFEKFARRCSRRHKQTTFSDADFLGALRVKSGSQGRYGNVLLLKLVNKYHSALLIKQSTACSKMLHASLFLEAIL